MNSRIAELVKPTVVALGVMTLGLSGVMGSTAVAKSSKVNTVTAHLHAVVDVSTARPECSLGSTLPDCHVSYSGGTGEYSGGLVGTLSFSGYGYIRDDGKVAIQEDEDIFTGTLQGCGTGAFTYSASGVFNFDAAKGGLVGDEVLKVVPGSGTGDLKGLDGGATGTFVVNPDGSIDADYEWAVTCGNHPASHAQSSKVNTVTAHLHAVVDVSTARPECSLGSTLPDCHVSYSGGTGEYSGGLVGTLSFSGYGYIRDDGKVAIQEDEDIFTGTLQGCGTGAFTYSASGVFNFDAARGGLVGDQVLKVVPGSGSGDLKGLDGGATGTFVINPDGTFDADYEWVVTCGNQRKRHAQ